MVELKETSNGSSLVAQMVKNLPAMWETQVQSLGQEDPLRREWQSTRVFLPGESHGQRSLVGHSPWGCKKSDMTEQPTLPMVSGKMRNRGLVPEKSSEFSFSLFLRAVGKVLVVLSSVLFVLNS